MNIAKSEKQNDTKREHDIQLEIDKQIIAETENIKTNDAFKDWCEGLLDD